jgi:CDP-diacylglycerol--serine O-phosphatidyltransferase
LGKFGWAAAFLYVACAALRLARFNTQVDTADSNFFSGLASPPAAAVIAGTVWVAQDYGLVADEIPVAISILAALLTTVVGLLMVLNVKYYSFKGFDLRGRVPFVVLIAVVLAAGVVMMDPPLVLLAMAICYALSAPVTMACEKLGLFRSS